MTTNETGTPAQRWGLTEHALVTVDGTDYVLYSDDQHMWAMDAAAYHAPTEESDYSLWCSGEGSGIGDHRLLVRILEAAREQDPVSPDCVLAAGSCDTVDLPLET